MYRFGILDADDAADPIFLSSLANYYTTETNEIRALSDPLKVVLAGRNISDSFVMRISYGCA